MNLLRWLAFIWQIAPSLCSPHSWLWLDPASKGFFYCCLGSIRWLSPLWSFWLMLLFEVSFPTNSAFPTHSPPFSSACAHLKFHWGEAINAVLCNNIRSFSWGVGVTSCCSCCFYASMFLSKTQSARLTSASSTPGVSFQAWCISQIRWRQARISQTATELCLFGEAG